MFKIDLHVHTILGGDSLIQPDQLVPRCREVGLDAVCITEHHSYFLSDPFKDISRETGFPIFQGLEYRAAEGHLLLYGIKVEQEEMPPRLPMQWVVNWVQKRGGVAIPAHPYQGGMVNGFPGDQVLRLEGLYALEMLNGALSSCRNYLAVKAAIQLGINGTAGSDAHGLPVLGRAYTRFQTPITSEKELVDALRNGGYIPCWNDEFYPSDRVTHWLEKSMGSC
jgi:predicted metal-dependent phosphoesterase TrpH